MSVCKNGDHMRTDEIIEEIIRGNQTEEVFKILTDILIEQKTNYMEAMNEYRNSLVAIHKINKGNNKAIDTLSEV